MKWLGWRVGQEYGRTVTVKNLSADLLHLSWSIPATKSFVLEYPEPIHLSPGMSYSLKVIHSPVWCLLSLSCRQAKMQVGIAYIYGSHYLVNSVLVAVGHLLPNQTRAM